VILIVSSLDDDHAVAVMRRLDSLGTAHRLLDLSAFPRTLRLTHAIDGGGRLARCGFRSGDGEIDLLAAETAWWRRPQPFELDDEIATDAYRLFVQEECHEAVAGMWLTLDAFWINDPAADDAASRKLNQLAAATATGLDVPSTCVTSDPVAATRFIESVGADNVVYKSFSAHEHAWRETRLLRRDEFAFLDRVRYAPVIFQEFVPAEADLRVTIMGPHCFAAAIRTAPAGYRYDYRMDLEHAVVVPFELPGDVEEGLFALLRRLRLVYGAIDMRLTPDGRYVFLEVNPSGQWLFIEDRTGQPMTDTFAQLLSDPSTHEPARGRDDGRVTAG
jgi:hypothetical protein